MRRLLISTAIIALLGCDQAEDSNDPMSPNGMTPASSSGGGGSMAVDEPSTQAARTDVIALAQEAGEATAEQCPNGGVVLNLGVDTNGNGVLDDDEVTGNEVVCNGRDGRDGRDGQRGEDGEGCTLTNNGDGTATLTCPDGSGVRLQDAGEASDGGDVSLQTINGSFTANVGADIEQLQPVEVIRGSLTITGNELRDCTLPNLKRVTGDLVITDAPNLLAYETDSYFPALEEIGGGLEISSTVRLTGSQMLPSLTSLGSLTLTNNAVFTELLVPQLSSVTGDIYIANNEMLTQVSLPALTGLGGSISMPDNAILATVSLPSLVSVSGNISLLEHAILTELSLPELTTVGGYLNVGTNAQLAELSLPALTTVGGNLGVSRNNQLTELPLPELTTVGGDLDVNNNRQLTELSLPALTSVSDSLNVVNNDQLPQLSLPALNSVGGNLDVRDNDNTQFTEFSLPLLTSVGRGLFGGDLFVRSNFQLTEFSLPELTYVGGSLRVDSNSFGECDIQAQLDAGNGVQCGGD